MTGAPPDPAPGRSGLVAGYRPEILQGLWEALPPGMRLAYFSAAAVPEEFRGGLAHQRGRTTGVDLSGLPAPMRQELAWCVFRIIEQGGKLDVTHMRALVRRLGEVISDLGAGPRFLLPGWRCGIGSCRSRSRCSAAPVPCPRWAPPGTSASS